MAEVRLQGPGVVACVRQGITAGMAKHVSVGLEAQACRLTSALHHATNPAALSGAPRSETNTKGLWLLSR
jgi:hypothetical protein